MKRAILFAVPLLAVLCASCAKEIDKTEQIAQDEQVLTVVARTGDSSDTKTLVQSDGTSIYWTAGDAINLFYGSGSAGQFTTSITEPSDIAEFTGTISVATGSTETGHEAKSFWAVYPYNAANTCDGTGVTLTIPGSQETVPGSFADKLNPTVATSPGLDLTFYNVGSWFIFSVTQEGVTSAEFRGNNNEDVAGTVRVSMDGSSRPVATVQNGVKSITITPAGGGSFTVGELYYIVVLPQTMENGYTLKLKKGSLEAECVVSTSATFTRSQYRRKRNADSGLTYISNNIDFEDSLVKSLCVTNWDTDGDGELSYDEAAAVTTLNKVFEYKSITRFNELRYFTSLLTIKSYDFYGSQIEYIHIPESVTSIESRAFGRCSNLKRFEGKFASEDGKLLIAEVNGKRTLLGFADPDATEVTIPSSTIDVEYVDDMVFYAHQNLMTIYCNCECGYHPFEDCPSAKNMTLSENVASDYNGFQNDLPSVEYLTVLGDGAESWYDAPILSLGFGGRLKSITLTKNTQIMNNTGPGQSALPFGCTIYGPNSTPDHTCWIVNGELFLFGFPEGASSYTLPSTVTKLSASITNWRYDDSVYDGYIEAFDNLRVYVPGSVTTISYPANIHIPLYMLGATPPTIEDPISMEGQCVIYVKSQYYSTYSSAWSSYDCIDLRTY